MKIKIYTVGGTIDKIYFDKKNTYQIGKPQIQEILSEVNVTFEYECESVLYKDSLDMTEKDRELIHQKISSDKSERIIITHGTDTMIQTAKKLIDIPKKTIVLTGALQPAMFKKSDAEFNVGCAIGAVQSLPYGVYIVMNGQIFYPNNVQKNQKYNRFEETTA